MEEKLATPRFLLFSAVGLGVLAGLIPVLLAWAVLGGVRSLRPAEAIPLLESETAVLVDVQSTAEFAKSHVQEAVNLPLEKVYQLHSSMDLPEELKGKTLVVMCEAGFASARAARRLAALGLDVYHVRGGLQEWGRDGPRMAASDAGSTPWLAQTPYASIVNETGHPGKPYKSLSQIQQAAAAFGLTVVKPIYMLLSLVLIVVLLRGKDLDVRLAGWGVLFFWLGEVACAIHYTVLKDDSYLAEYLHSYGMVLAFSLVTYALLEGIDQRLIHFSAFGKRCAMVELCKSCVKNPAIEMSTARCGIRRLALILIPLGALLALIPLSAPISTNAYNTNIGPIIHFNIRTVIQQLFETRYSPIAAMVLFGLAWVVLIFFHRMILHPLARLLASYAFGFLAFSYFRTGLGLMFEDALAVGMFWEEATELMFILVSFYVLWVFRHALLPGHLFPAKVVRLFSG